ncbi:uncharacterized protein [Parasteatoda tepidariorum]|uniref:uncharacterized protein n=1 Tax=Parasteatoda tepidariorum TaxID=114398 RepID=UPI001C719ED1|nr:uncharacterized protein LOC107452667 [Parasteatoda tepidariorum]
MPAKSSFGKKKTQSVRHYASVVFRESSVNVLSGIVTAATIPRKLFRIVVFSLFLIAFMYQCVRFLNYVLEYPTILNIDIASPDTYIAPAYTWCNNQKFSRKKYCEKYPDHCMEINEEFCKENVHYCKNANIKVKNEYLQNKTEIGDIYHLVHNIEDTLYILLSTTEAPQLSIDLLLRLRSLENLLDFSICFNANSAVNSQEMPLVYKRLEYHKAFFRVDHKFKIDCHEDDIFDPNILPGILFEVHSPFEAVNPFLTGYFLQPGRHYKITIHLKEEKLLPSPYKTDCIDYDNKWLNNGKSGPRSQEMCRQKCIVDFISHCFNCTHLFFTYPSDKRDLCPPGMKNMNITINDENCYEMYQQIEVCIMTCKEECLKVSFSTEVKEMYLSRNKPDNNSTSNSRFIYLDVDINDKEITRFEFSPKYQNVEAFSYIGGFIGIWLGVSLVQVADFLESIFLIIRYFLKKNRRPLKEIEVSS